MEKKYKFLADLVFAFHMIVIVVLIIQPFLFLLGVYPAYRLLMNLHLIFTLSVLVSQICFLGCPLTLLEWSLRAKYQEEIPFKGSFVVYLIEKFTHKKIPPTLITGITVFIVIISSIVLIFNM